MQQTRWGITDSYVQDCFLVRHSEFLEFCHQYMSSKDPRKITLCFLFNTFVGAKRFKHKMCSCWLEASQITSVVRTSVSIPKCQTIILFRTRFVTASCSKCFKCSSSRAGSTELYKIRVLLILLYKNFYKPGQNIQLNNKLDYTKPGYRPYLSIRCVCAEESVFDWLVVVPESPERDAKDEVS